MEEKTAILPTAYFGNIEYYSTLLKYDNILIEAHEHYVKQTFRNRCVIATANGPLTLTVPAHHSNTKKTKTKDVKIDYSKNWQKQHFKAIESAYRKSPFYEFYMDDFMFVFERKEKFLLDLNMKILLKIFEHVDIHKKILLTKEYTNNEQSETFLKMPNSKRKTIFKPYHQLFSARHKFIENLCFLDLLYNEGSNYKKFFIS